ncbi:MAG: PAS domain S-box protein [Verrucomicrobia bacterium]|nr:PAS domain S-box protein [Verrucomicrobiota bacterium]
MDHGLEADNSVYRLLVEHSQAAIYLLSPEGNFEYVSPSCCRLAGLEASQLLGANFRPFVHPADLDYCLEMFRNAQRTRKAQTQYEYRVIRSDGSLRTIRTVLVPVIDAQGELRQFVGNSIDITEEEDARAQAERLSCLARLTESGVVCTDKDFKINWVNDAFLRQTGYKEAEVLGRSPLFQTGALTGVGKIAEHEEKVARQEAFSDDIHIYKKSGESYYVHLNAMPIYDRKGKFAGYIGLQTDLTERLAIETQLRQLNEQLSEALWEAAEASRAKSEFVANMSHEIRTPMTAIIGIARMLQESGAVAGQTKLLRILSDNAHSLMDLLDDILDVSKIEAGKLDVVEEAFALPEFFDRIIDCAAVRVHGKQLEFKAHLDPALPRVVKAAPVRIRQIIQNLLNNALKFTHEGGIALDVKVRELNETQVTLVIEVADSGIGIAADKQHLLFGRFEQLHPSESKEFGGTGIGLAICRKLCELLSGTIELESPVTEPLFSGGPGTRITVTLSLKLLASAEEEALRAAQRITLQSLQLQGTVLCVEDNEANRVVVGWMLNRRGVEVDFRETGEEALVAMAAKQYDLVFMDVQLPGISGLETSSHWRSQIEPAVLTAEPHRKRTPIVAMTAHAMADDRQHCLSAGMDAYISKPINEGELLQVLQRYLASTGNAHMDTNVAPSAAATIGTGAPLINWSEIVRFFDSNEEIILTMAETLLRDLQQLKAALAMQYKSRQYEQLRATLHKMKGVSGYLMVEELMRRLELAEHQCAKRGGEFENHINRILELVTQAETELSQRLQRKTV